MWPKIEDLKFIRNVFIYTIMALVLSAACFSSGCWVVKRPRLRAGAFFGSPTGMDFPNPKKLGNHRSKFNLGEKNGMLYTCKAGFIDLGHLREAADRTAYLTEVTYKNLMRNNTEFSFRVIEPSRYWVKISYPQNWQQLSEEEKESVANDISINLGQYYAHKSLIWHEILTWYGFSSAGIFPDTISSFSWEDTYSDLLGTCLAVQAMRDDQQEFDVAMTELIDQTLENLDVQPPKVARKAVKKIRGQWYSGGMYFFVDMKKRNFDTGLNDGRITPSLVPEICPGAEPQLCSTPTLKKLSRYGIKMGLEIEPRTWEQARLFRAINLNKKEKRINPEVHFPLLLEKIKSQEK